MSRPAKSILDDLPPSVNFCPSDEQIIELYLLPRVRGQPDLFPGLIIDDDSAGNTQPWKLFRRHGLPDDVPAFFYIRTNGAARPDRTCDGGGWWKSQRRERKADEKKNELVLENGEKVKWSRHNLNFNMGSGSVGWVMHEYSIPASPCLKICRISLSGHGQKRMRSSDEYDDCLADEPATQRRRAAAVDSGSSCASDSWTKNAYEDHQEPIHLTCDADITAMVEELIDADAQPYAVPVMEVDHVSSSGSDSWTKHASEDRQEPIQLTSDADITDMVEELIDADAQPYMVPTMEQHVDQVRPSAVQTSEEQEISEQIDPRSQHYVACDETVPVMQEQHFDREEPNMFFDGTSYTDLLLQGIMAPSTCSVPNASDVDTGMRQGVLDWEGFRFVF